MKANKLVLILLILAAASLFVYAGNNSEVTKTFKVSKGGSLKVNIAAGNISIDSWSNNEVAVKVDGVDDEDRNLLEISQSGNTINVEYNGSGNWNNTDVVISVPGEFNLDLNTNQGDVDVNNNIVGTIKAYSAGGDINLKDVGGNTTVKTNGGDISTGNIAGDLQLSTNGGDINVKNVGGKGEVRTMGGSINMDNITKELNAKTFGGDISIGSIGGNAKVSTMGGSISVGKITGSADVQTNGGDIKIAGASGYTKAKTLGGNISLSNITGNIDASTASGNVYAQLTPSGKGKSNISSLSGTVKLLIDPNAKATIEADVKMGDMDESEKMIESDFPAKDFKKGDHSPNVKATYLINGGGELIKLSTMNDKIFIKKLSK